MERFTRRRFNIALLSSAVITLSECYDVAFAMPAYSDGSMDFHEKPEQLGVVGGDHAREKSPASRSSLASFAECRVQEFGLRTERKIDTDERPETGTHWENAADREYLVLSYGNDQLLKEVKGGANRLASGSLEPIRDGLLFVERASSVIDAGEYASHSWRFQVSPSNETALKMQQDFDKVVLGMGAKAAISKLPLGSGGATAIALVVGLAIDAVVGRNKIELSDSLKSSVSRSRLARELAFSSTRSWLNNSFEKLSRISNGAGVIELRPLRADDY